MSEEGNISPNLQKTISEWRNDDFEKNDDDDVITPSLEAEISTWNPVFTPEAAVDDSSTNRETEVNETAVSPQLAGEILKWTEWSPTPGATTLPTVSPSTSRACQPVEIGEDLASEILQWSQWDATSPKNAPSTSKRPSSGKRPRSPDLQEGKGKGKKKMEFPWERILDELQKQEDERGEMESSSSDEVPNFLEIIKKIETRRDTESSDSD